MSHTQKKAKLHYDHLLWKLLEINHNFPAPERMDFYALLGEMSSYYNLTAEELKSRGFRRAYRQAVEGL